MAKKSTRSIDIFLFKKRFLNEEEFQFRNFGFASTAVGPTSLQRRGGSSRVRDEPGENDHFANCVFAGLRVFSMNNLRWTTDVELNWRIFCEITKVEKM